MADAEAANGVKKPPATELNSMTQQLSSSNVVEARGSWGKKADFFLSAIGYAVGLGNVWRFPYLCYKNGGGAFLFPYVIMLAFCGLPLFYLEMAFGQFSSRGPITMWKASPIFKGVGWGMIIVSFLTSIYYNIIIAWTLFYFFASMTSELPWESCGNSDWNTPLCARTRGVESTHVFDTPYMVMSNKVDLLDEDYLNKTFSGAYDGFNCTEVMGATGVKSVGCILSNITVKDLDKFDLSLVSPAEEYWNNRVLRRSEGIDAPGEILWDLCLCLLLAWIVVILCIIKGVKSSGKVVYFTATFPYIILTILLIRGALLEGASDGVYFYLVPDFNQLATAGVWKDAATQIFYSLGVAFGGLQVMASYNKFHNNVMRDSIIVALINCGTSVYAGFAIFSMIGYLGVKTGLPVKDAVTSGPGLAFVAYPEGISRMPASPLWSLLFFFMLFTLGLDSQFVMVETVVSGLVDEFHVLQKKWNKIALIVGIGVISFFLGLPMVTRGGVYWFQIMDWYAAGHSILILALFEVLGISYVYGIKRFISDLEMMMGKKHRFEWLYWVACWTVISPVLIVFILIFASAQYVPVYYEEYMYPQWGENIGWCMALAAILQIPLWATIVFCSKSGLYKYIKEAAVSHPEWGPALPEDRTGQYALDGESNGGFASSERKLSTNL